MMSAGNARQPLLGLGILLLTLIPGYIASRVTGVSGRVTDLSENVTDISESTQSSTRIAFYIRTDFHIKDESDIRELAARYGLSEDLIAAVIAAASAINPRAGSCRGARRPMPPLPPTAATPRRRAPPQPTEKIQGGVRPHRAALGFPQLGRQRGGRSGAAPAAPAGEPHPAAAWKSPRARTRGSTGWPGAHGRRHDGLRVPFTVHADPGRPPHAEESDLLLGPRRGHGRGRPAHRAARAVPRGEGARRLCAHDLRRFLERPPLVARRPVAADRGPRRLRDSSVPGHRRSCASPRLSRLHPAHPSRAPGPVRSGGCERPPRAVADPGTGSSRGSARAGGGADRRARARLRRGRAPLPGRRPRRDRALDGAQSPDRSVLVAPLQRAA